MERSSGAIDLARCDGLVTVLAMSSRLYLTLALSLALVGCDQVNMDTTSMPPRPTTRTIPITNRPSRISIIIIRPAPSPITKPRWRPIRNWPAPHYELGVIYGDKMNDPVSSIYHFKRFIDLSPNSDKKDQVQALIDKEGTALRRVAAELLRRSAPRTSRSCRPKTPR